MTWAEDKILSGYWFFLRIYPDEKVVYRTEWDRALVLYNKIVGDWAILDAVPVLPEQGDFDLGTRIAKPADNLEIFGKGFIGLRVSQKEYDELLSIVQTWDQRWYQRNEL